MQEGLDPMSSILYAQVREAGPSHGYDLEGYLRPKAHPANISNIYLGDVAKTLLKVVQGHSTPTMVKKPGFDEQKWAFECRSGDVIINVKSYSYIILSRNRINIFYEITRRFKILRINLALYQKTSF